DVLAAGLGLADRLGAGIALVLQLLRLDLQRLALLLERGKARRIQLKAASAQSRGDIIEVRSQTSRVEHPHTPGLVTAAGIVPGSAALETPRQALAPQRGCRRQDCPCFFRRSSSRSRARRSPILISRPRSLGS